ncbi:retrovirus-related Pol polyprotein from transposon 17.6 [Trichonephila clavipes]|nr:retrovirus-related Pol polyprotein from transposon 17.6 [Trichonephila clavipes]
MKLNQIASEERSGLSSAQTENPVLSALADRLQEINLRVGRLQEASAVTARKSGGNYSNRRENVFKCFYCGIQGHRQAECRKRQRDERAARYQPPRRNAASGNEFRRQIADLEKAGIISKSNSQYNTPALFVKQKEKWRLVLDFRKLNEITVTQDFVIPTLDDILHEISGSNYFSALDMKSAFNQIPLHFADRHKTAFSTPVGRKFKVFTDHKPLAGLLSNKNPSSKILRWKLALEEFNYDIHYIRGSLNSVADHLSRYINNITIALPDSKDLINMQREDSVLSTIIQKIDQNDVSPQISNYFINGEGLLCHLSKRPSRSPRSNTTRKQVCIPHCLKAKILESVHSEYGGHLKFFKTYHRLSENFFWHNMYKDTKNFVRSCTICLSRKNAFKIPPAPHQLVEQSTEPGETCHMDIFGP